MNYTPTLYPVRAGKIAKTGRELPSIEAEYNTAAEARAAKTAEQEAAGHFISFAGFTSVESEVSRRHDADLYAYAYELTTPDDLEPLGIDPAPFQAARLVVLKLKTNTVTAVIC